MEWKMYALKQFTNLVNNSGSENAYHFIILHII